MKAFADAMDALFADPNLAQDATYTPVGGGASSAVRVIIRRPDVIEGFGGGRFVADTIRIDVRVSDVAELSDGDAFEVDGSTFTVAGAPVRDARRLKWKAEAR